MKNIFMGLLLLTSFNSLASFDVLTHYVISDLQYQESMNRIVFDTNKGRGQLNCNRNEIRMGADIAVANLSAIACVELQSILMENAPGTVNIYYSLKNKSVARVEIID